MTHRYAPDRPKGQAWLPPGSVLSWVVLKVGPWTSGTDMTWELVNDAKSWVPPQTYWIRISGGWGSQPFVSPPDDSVGGQVWDAAEQAGNEVETTDPGCVNPKHGTTACGLHAHRAGWWQLRSGLPLLCTRPRAKALVAETDSNPWCVGIIITPSLALRNLRALVTCLRPCYS